MILAPYRKVIAILTLLLLVAPRGFASADTVITNPLSDVHIYCFLISMLQVLISILLPFAAVALIIAGFLLVAARGNVTQLVFAKKFLLWTLVATALILGVFGIISLVQGTINAVFPGLISTPACPTGNNSSGGNGGTPPPATPPPDLAGGGGGSNGGGNFPTVPDAMNLTASAPDSAGVDLSYSPPSGKFVAKYRIARLSSLGNESFDTTDTSFTDTSVTPGETYTYAVTALDSSGGIVAQSNQVPVAVPEPTGGADPGRSQCGITFVANSTPPTFGLGQGYSVTGTVTASASCVGPVSLVALGSQGPIGSLEIEPGTSKTINFPGETFLQEKVGGPYTLPDGRKVLERRVDPDVHTTEIHVSDACGSVTADASLETCFAGYDILATDGKSALSCPAIDSQIQSPPVTVHPASEQNSVVPTVSQIVPASIKLSFDESYVEQTKVNRKFTPSGNFSLYDDIGVSLRLKTCANKPDTLPFTINIVTSDIEGKSVSIPISASEFALDKSSADSSAPTYTAIITGWPNGLSPFSKDAEILIDSIATSRPIALRITDEAGKFQDTAIPMTNCVQEYGAGNLSVVSMRGLSTNLAPKELMAKSADIRENGFNAVDPFKTYFSSFAFYTDLAKYQDSLAGEIPIYRRITPSCQPEPSIYYFYTTKTSSGVAESAFFSHQVLIQPDVRTALSQLSLKYPKFVSATMPLGIVAIHEGAHGFAGVMDEYAYDEPGLGEGGPFDFLTYMGSQQTTNCVIDPNNANAGYVYGGKLYGDRNIQDCSTILLQRPSPNSIMRHETDLPGSEKFNVISCGYIVAAINQVDVRNGPAYWPECMMMDTIKPAVSP